MTLLALFLKAVIWLVVFWSVKGDNWKDMLLWTAGMTVVLTVMDKVSVASNLAAPAIVLTLVLYGLMSFTLIPLAWTARNATFSRVVNVVGVLGAFAGVNSPWIASGPSCRR